jgi:glycosyl transferase family 25
MRPPFFAYDGRGTVVASVPGDRFLIHLGNDLRGGRILETSDTIVLTAKVISMRNRGDRRDMVARHLADWTISWSFFDACTALSPSRFQTDLQRQYRRYGRALTPSEIGCAKSHLAVLEAFVSESPCDWLLVLEDDVWVDPLFDLPALVAYLSQRDVHYLRLFAKYWKPAKVLGRWRDRQVIRFKTDPYGSQAYLIDKTGAASLLRTTRSIDLTIDDELGRFWINRLPIYAIYPFPVCEMQSASGIEQERQSAARAGRSVARETTRVFNKAEKLSENVRLAMTSDARVFRA